MSILTAALEMLLRPPRLFLEMDVNGDGTVSYSGCSWERLFLTRYSDTPQLYLNIRLATKHVGIHIYIYTYT